MSKIVLYISVIILMANAIIMFCIINKTRIKEVEIDSYKLDIMAISSIMAFLLIINNLIINENILFIINLIGNMLIISFILQILHMGDTGVVFHKRKSMKRK